MNPENLRVLAERAVAVEGRPTQRLDEVHARIAQARRRRQVGAIGAAVVAVVMALGAGLAFVALTETDHTPPAVPAPRPSVTPHAPEEKTESVRLLTYADGHTIHWGDRAIDVGSTVQGVGATDDGVVFVRGDRAARYSGDACRTLWFSDGSDPVRLGMVTGSRIRGFGVDLATAGSTVLWAEPRPKDRSNPYYPEINEYVVYDTRTQREVARFGSHGRDPDSDGHDHLVIQAVFDDSVYWTPDDRATEWCLDYRKYYGACRRFPSVMRLDTRPAPRPSFLGRRTSRIDSAGRACSSGRRTSPTLPSTRSPPTDLVHKRWASGARATASWRGTSAASGHCRGWVDPARRCGCVCPPATTATWSRSSSRCGSTTTGSPSSREPGGHPGLRAVRRAVSGRGQGPHGLWLRWPRMTAWFSAVRVRRSVVHEGDP